MSETVFQPMHARIRDQFYRRIIAGDWAPGQRLPSESEIMTQFKVSRGTVTRALRDLELQGILHRRRGAGTFVREAQVVQRAENRHIAMFVSWAIHGEPFGFVQGNIHHLLSSMCTGNDVQLSLQGLTAEGATLRERMLNAAKVLLARKVKVVLFCPNEMPHEEMVWNREVVDLLVAGGVRVVLIDRDIASHPDRSELTWVSFDNFRGGSMLVNHLYKQGYRRIAFIGIPRESSAVAHRLGGYIDGLNCCGLPFDKSLVFAPEQVDDAFCEHMMSTARPDAVIGKDSDVAAMISRCLSARGLRIGTDIGVAGFDDAPIASLLPVPLTVIRQPVEPFAAAAFQVAESYLNGDGRHVNGEQIVIRVELIARASTMRG